MTETILILAVLLGICVVISIFLAIREGSLNATIKELRDKLDYAERSLREAQSKVESIRDESLNKAKNFSSLKEHVKKLKEKNFRLKTDNKSLRDQVNQLEANRGERSGYHQQSSKEREELEERLKRSQGDISQLKQQNTQLSQKISELEERTKERYEQFEERVSAKQRKVEDQTEERYKKLSKKHKEFVDLMLTKERELRVLKKKYDKSEQIYRIQKSQLEAAQDRILMLEGTPRIERPAKRKKQKNKPDVVTTAPVETIPAEQADSAGEVSRESAAREIEQPQQPSPESTPSAPTTVSAENTSPAIEPQTNDDSVTAKEAENAVTITPDATPDAQPPATVGEAEQHKSEQPAS